MCLLIFAASGCRSHSPEELKRLVGELKSRDGSVRNQAALALGEFGEDGREAVPDLIRVLQRDPSRGIRTSAAFALRKIGTKEAVDALDNYRE